MTGLTNGRGRNALWSLPAATLIAGITGVAANALLYSLAGLGGLIDESVVLPSLLGMGPLTLTSVTITTVAALVAAGILLAVLVATTRRPVRIFRIVATVLAVVSLAMPATIPGPPPAMRLTMAVFHVVAWAVSVLVLATVAEREAERVA
jgi:hypothetical protein